VTEKTSDGKYQRTRKIKLRQIASRLRTAQENTEQRGRGHIAQRPITLPPMPWDVKKADSDA
jgi:hypothetical protein